VLVEFNRAPGYGDNVQIELDALPRKGVGELLDIVVDEITGLAVRPGNSDDLARALKVLYQDSFRRQALGFSGLTRVRSRYSWDRIAADALTVYRRAHHANDSADRANRRPYDLSVQ
jgi:hypothetical protein